MGQAVYKSAQLLTFNEIISLESVKLMLKIKFDIYSHRYPFRLEP